MNIRQRIIAFFCILSLLVLSACLFNSQRQAVPTIEPTATTPVLTKTVPETPKQVETEAPTPFYDNLDYDFAESEMVTIWAKDAQASSNRETTNWHAAQALGLPDTLVCGNFVTAWQPADDETEATLELSFFPYVLPSNLVLHQSFQPGQIYLVELIGVDGTVFSVYSESFPQGALPGELCGTGFYIPLPEVDILISSVRLHLRRDPHSTWTQIDAAGLQGWVAEESEPDEGGNEGIAEEYSYDTPFSYFNNSNQVHGLALMKGEAWSVNGAGVTVWDLETLAFTQYTANEGLSGNVQNAVVLCPIPEIVAVVGGKLGISFLDLQGDPYWQTLEHPDDEWLGAVTALGCDVQKQHLWVGYAGHLSRFDFEMKSWKEYDQSDGMPLDEVRQIIVIGDETWVVTGAGAVVVRKNGRLDSFTIENSAIPEQMLHGITVDNLGDVWMASSAGLLHFDGDQWELLDASVISDGQLLNILLEITPLVEGSFWVGDVYGTVCRFDPLSERCLEVKTPPENFTGLLSGLAVDDLGRLVISNDVDGIWLVDGEEWFPMQITPLALTNEWKAISESPDGTIWLAGKDFFQSFQVNNPHANWQTILLPAGAKPGTLAVEARGVWLGHTLGARFIPYLGGDSLDLVVDRNGEKGIRDSVTVIRGDEAGRTWFGTWSGLSVWDGQSYQQADLLSQQERDQKKVAPRVNAIFHAGETAWVGAVNGLHRFENGVWQQSYSQELVGNGNYNASVGAISATHDAGGLLIAVWNRLLFYDGTEFVELLQVPSEIRTLYLDEYGNVWLASAYDGIYMGQLEGSGNLYWSKLFEGQTAMSQNFGYQSIIMDHQRSVWFASQDSGLTRYVVCCFGQ